MRPADQIENLSAVVRDALGAGCRIVGADRLRGGSKKGVYRVRLAGGDPPSVIVYRWAADENYWPGSADGDPTDPFAPATGLAPFLAAHRTLGRIGARVARVWYVDDRRRRGAADFAVVDDIPGGTLETLWDTDPGRARAVVADLARTLEVMQRHRAPRYGRVDVLERGHTGLRTPGEQVILDRARRDLADTARRDNRINAAQGRIGTRLDQLRALAPARTDYGLVHGELGPDHVLVNAEGNAVLIDIEGLMYFDIEWEHVFLQLRFGKHYPPLSRPGLDPRRLELYALAMRLSLVAGPMRLLDGDFPDRDRMRGIAEHNLAAVLALAP